ncbi:unnamed protein product [Cercospora beticola]|nr:unnamed protein product [Cercospora beticola]
MPRGHQKRSRHPLRILSDFTCILHHIPTSVTPSARQLLTMAPRSLLLAALSASTSFLAQAAPAARRQEDNLARDLATLKAFAETITEDPQNIKANWTAAGDDVCQWAGVTCAERPDGVLAVAGIDFNNYEFGPALRADLILDKLLDITFFHANSNSFTGTLPDVSALKYLYEVDFSNNRLSGMFPLEILNAPLTFLDLRFNNFIRELPEKLFQMTDLTVIFLNNNAFSGPIPDIGPTFNTSYITLANNNLTGPIPDSWANNQALTELLIANNTEVTGVIPDKLCALPNVTLIDVSGNSGMTGRLGPKCRQYAKEADRDAKNPPKDNSTIARIFNIEGTGLTL